MNFFGHFWTYLLFRHIVTLGHIWPILKYFGVLVVRSKLKQFGLFLKKKVLSTYKAHWYFFFSFNFADLVFYRTNHVFIWRVHCLDIIGLHFLVLKQCRRQTGQRTENRMQLWKQSESNQLIQASKWAKATKTSATWKFYWAFAI